MTEFGKLKKCSEDTAVRGVNDNSLTEFCNLNFGTPPQKKIIKQCKYCGRTHTRGACSTFHQSCNNCHKNGHFANVWISTNKSLYYLDNWNTPPTTAEEG